MAPWEFEGEVSTAKATLREAIEKMGGKVVVDQDRYGGLFPPTCMSLIHSSSTFEYVEFLKSQIGRDNTLAVNAVVSTIHQFL